MNNMDYIDIGKGDVIVLIPGLGMNISAYDTQHELSNTYRLIVPDVNQCKTVDEAAWKVIELLNKLNINSAHIVGISLGGVIAQLIYKYDKSKVKSLTLSNSFTSVSSCILEYAVQLRERELNNSTDEEYIGKVVSDCVFKQDVKEYAKTLFTINRDTYSSLMWSVVEANKTLDNVAKAIDVPVLLIGSWYDTTTLLVCQWTQKALIKGSRLETFHCGHLSNVECADEFNDILRNFISGVDNN